MDTLLSKGVRFCLLLLGVLLCSPESRSQEKQITVRVIVPPSTPKEATVFIAGNAPQFGNWNPGAIKMRRENDSVWSRTANAPMGVLVEFKITRGSWATQAVYQEGVIPQNTTFVVANDTVIILHPISWSDVLATVKAKETGGGIVGTVKYHRAMKGEGLNHERDIIVWLPPSYEKSQQVRYPVLYMHDGQNVFDPATSFLGYDWQADEMADSLIKQNSMNEIIIVGIYNTPDRAPEYSDTDQGRSYARFVVNILKPFIDSTYRTKPEREHTAVMGSSMGGLISFLFGWWYPDVFSQAGCVSTAFVREVEGNLFEEVKTYDGPKKKVRFYFDVGELEPPLVDGYYRMIELLKEKGYQKGEDLEYYFDQGAVHNEQAWANRLWRPLLFMFGKKGN